MTRVTITEHYIELLMQRACFEEAPDGFYATVPEVPRLIAVGATAEGCARNLHQQLEQWTLESLARNDDLPIVEQINLNSAENRKWAAREVNRRTERVGRIYLDLAELDAELEAAAIDASDPS